MTPFADEVGQRQSIEPYTAAGVQECVNDVTGPRCLPKSWDKPGHGDPPLGDGDGVAGCHLLQQPGQMGLGLVRAHSFYGTCNSHTFRLVYDQSKFNADAKAPARLVS
jgi:hypothetical protein